MFRKLLLILIIGLSLAVPGRAQDDLMDLLDSMEEPSTDYTIATFKATRIVNAHTVELPAAGVMIFLIQHRFGRVNTGFQDFFGLDQATLRLGLEYGVTNWLTLGIGRSNIRKTWDSFVKFKILRQSTGKVNMPITLAWVSAVQINGLDWKDPDRENYFSSRVSYSHQLLVARKFSRRFSLQLMGSVVHRNFVETKEEENDVWSVGAAARYKLTGSIALTVEYFYNLPGYSADNFQNPLSMGIDIETGGHVFQLMVTNSRSLTENIFIPETAGKWSNGDLHLGFNISRVFTIVDYSRKKQGEKIKKEKKKKN